MNQNPDPRPAQQAYARKVRALPYSERRAIGLRLQAIHGGQAAVRSNALRGIDGHAMAARARAGKRKRDTNDIAKVLLDNEL